MFGVAHKAAIGITSRLASLVLSPKPSQAEGAGPHALSILGSIAKDPAFTPKALNLPIPDGEKDTAIERTVRLAGAKLVEYASQWTVGSTLEEIEAKFEEVAWMNSVIYAVGGWAGRKVSEDDKGEFNADFFL